MRKIQKRSPNYKHGMSKHPLHTVYNNIVIRCYYKKSNRYSYYGARGITMCDAWLNDNKSFFTWAFANGWRKGLEIDRIDNNKGYSPENCRFVTHTENLYNRSCTRRLEYNGVTRTLKEWSIIVGVNVSLLKDRLRAGKNAHYVLFEPKHKNKYV